MLGWVFDPNADTLHMSIFPAGTGGLASTPSTVVVPDPHWYPYTNTVLAAISPQSHPVSVPVEPRPYFVTSLPSMKTPIAPRVIPMRVPNSSPTSAASRQVDLSSPINGHGRHATGEELTIRNPIFCSALPEPSSLSTPPVLAPGASADVQKVTHPVLASNWSAFGSPGCKRGRDDGLSSVMATWSTTSEATTTTAHGRARRQRRSS
ncbi:Uncharacterized protein PBTT_08898 [Plasmodiophora brassicae]